MVKKFKCNILFSCFAISWIFLSTHLYTKSTTLNKIKDKIGKTTSSTIKITKDNFKNIIGNKKNDTDYKKRIGKLYQLVDAINLKGNSRIKGLDLFAHILDKTLDDLQNFTESAVWSKNEAFIIECNRQYANSRESSIIFLCDTIAQVYKDAKSPLISFVLDVDNEEKQIEHFLKKLSKFTPNNIDNKNDLLRLETSVEQLNEMQENVDKIIDIINMLLKNENRN